MRGEDMAVNGQNFGLPDLSGLSDDERQQVIAVMKRAKDFEVQEGKSMRRPLEGQLYKYTNVMKGWQHRWFLLDPDSGMLEYFEKEEHKKQRARASIHLAGAVVCPSDEDSQTFTVNAANSEIYRLRAFDAKERQHWVDRLRATAQYHTAHLSQGAAYRSHPVTSHPDTPGETSPQDNVNVSAVTQVQRSQHKSPSSQPSVGTDVFTDAREHIHEADDFASSLSEKIEDLPTSGPILNSLDTDLLLMKATSMATLQCLSQCLNILHKRKTALRPGINVPNDRTIDPPPPNQTSNEFPTEVSLSETGVDTGTASPVGSLSSALSMPYHSPDSSLPVDIDHDEEIEDGEEYKEKDLEGVEEHKSIILHLLSQLKLGMDLTKVVLPTFILERRSLLELFADCMAHPNVFLRIPDLPDPKTRMLAVLQWYLTSFHAGRQGSVAKKPYNPIIGETFHCSWRLSPEEIQDCDTSAINLVDATSPESRTDTVEGEETDRGSNSKHIQLTYCAEQVSHHPPISAFYFECPDKQMYMNASIYTKSKFMGMSIGLVMVGKISLKLLSHDEEYVFGLPSVYARSILTVPWVELGDKIQITCQKTNMSAAVTFHTKPFYGGKLHRVSAEVKENDSGAILCKVQGEWNKSFEFIYSEEDVHEVNVEDQRLYRKRVRPLDKQGEYESRRLWQHVTNTLALGDVNIATEHKKFLEDRQREGERHRRETNTLFPTKFFHKEEESWVFNNPLESVPSSLSS